ncbi:hypothetical protein JKF63_00522 [Porcisia hertigi]|uniref:1-phosphatidylinositol 4-kinase n=1 Tax=Porcisia hertigi TaxID=2761500 RepID=A0A836KYE5_9TRYP|nr:hypothetical protein JKF63_00522 [Porcisia hertigi]
MNDIRFPGWIKSSPTLMMASVLAQLLANEFAETASSTAALCHTSQTCEHGGRGGWRSRLFSDECNMNNSIDRCDEAKLENFGPSEERCHDHVGQDALQGSTGGMDTGYLRMVERLLEQNSRELDSLPPAAGVASSTTYLPWKAATSTAAAMPTGATWSGPPRSSVAFTGLNGRGSMSAIGASPDILHDPRVRTLLRLSRLNDVLTGSKAPQLLISQRTAAAMVSFFAFAVSCRYNRLPADRTKGFFTECSALYTTLLSKLPSLRLCGGVSLEDFTASLVACGLKLRDDEGEEGGDEEAGASAPGTPGIPYSGRSNNNSVAVSGVARVGNGSGTDLRTPAPLSSAREKNWGLVGFCHRALDATFVHFIPKNINHCVHDAVAVGVLRGISLTHSHQLFCLGSQLVNHMHDLTDAFAMSSHRRELSYKRVFSVLLEAISCSRVIDYERTNNWITAIIQETYVVRGLFQREELHAHVVTATLTMLIRQYQEMAKGCAANVIELGMMPDFTEGDQLIELVWKALQDTIGSWEDAATAAERHPLTLFRHNIEVVVQHLLRTEVERLRCYYIITSARAAYHSSLVVLPAGSVTTTTQWHSSAVQPQLEMEKETQQPANVSPRAALGEPQGYTWRTTTAASAAAAPYVPPPKEESLRVLICGNIIKFLLLPTSIMNALPGTEEAKQLRKSLTEAAARVLSVVTARDFTSDEDTFVAAFDSSSPTTATSTATRTTIPTSAVAATPREMHNIEVAASSTPLLAGSRRRAHFSNNFYRSIEGLVQELIQTLLQQHNSGDAVATATIRDSLGGVSDEQPARPPVQDTGSDAMLRGMVAAVCLQYMCSANHHIRSFVTSEVMDMVVRLSIRRSVQDATSQKNSVANPPVDPEKAREQARQLRARRLALCFNAMSSILVPVVVNVEGSHHAAKAQEEKAGLARSGTTTSDRGESRRERLSRYGQLLCDTYLDSLHEHLSRAAEGRTSYSTMITPVMTVAVRALVDLVLRVHKRLHGMSSMALALVQEAQTGAGKPYKETRRSESAIEQDRKRLLHAFNAERMSVVLLLRGVIQCMLRVAWPSSGALYQNPVGGGQRPLDKRTSASVMAPIAFAALSPLLQPLTMLLHLSTLFPARSIKHLCMHHQYARYLTLEDLSNDDQHVFHYYHHLSRMHRVGEADGNNGAKTASAEDQMELECWALFRSCWLMFSYYKYTAESLLGVRYGGVAPRESPHPTPAGVVLDRPPILSTKQCTLVRLIAASAAPLLRMCSSDVQQAMADTAVLLRYALSGTRQDHVAAADANATSGILHTSLCKSLKQLCGGHKVVWKRLNTGELMILQSVAELEILRAATGSVAQLPLYRHFEVREFVASASIPEALSYILGTACEYYIRAVQSMLPGVASHVVRTNLSQLIFLLSFAIGSVRESASKLVMQIVESFPIYAAYSSGLPLLWCVLDLLETGTASQIEALCAHVHFAVAPAVAADPHRAERQRHTLFVANVAQRWAAVLREKSPLALFETAIKFMVVQQQESGEPTSTQTGRRAAGSQCAVLALQYGLEETPPNLDHSAVAVLHGAAAADSAVETDPVQTLVLYGHAQGTLLAASWYASADQIQNTVVAQLWEATSLSRRALATAVARQLESSILRPARVFFVETLYPLAPVLTLGTSTVDDKEDAAALKKVSGGPVSLRAPDRTETAAIFAAAVALLVSGNGIPTGRWQLLQYLVQGAVQTFRSEVLYDAILSWKWLLRQNREAYLLPILQELDTAFLWTANNRLGLFDGYCASNNWQVQTGEIPVRHDTTAASGYSGIGARAEAVTSMDGTIDSASPHKLLLSFLSDMYVVEGSPLCLTVEVLRHLYLVAAHIMQYSTVLSLRDNMFGETMRCMLVVGSVAQLLREANMRRLRAGLATIVPFSALGALRQRWYNALLRWFTKTPPRWYYAKRPEIAMEETKVVHSLLRLVNEEENLLTRTTLGFLDFSTSLPSKGDTPAARSWDSLSVVHEALVALRPALDSGGGTGFGKLIVREQQRLLGLLRLLRVLVEHEVLRLSVWRAPRRTLEIPNTTPSLGWEKLIECADHHNPAVVVAMVYRFSSIPTVRREASRRVVAHPERYAHVAEAVELYLTEDVLRAGAPRLFLFRTCTIIQALRLLHTHYTACETVSSYAMRSLLSQRSEVLIFYLPQLLQLLAMDKSGHIEAFLLHTSANSTMFAHQLLWSLQTEGESNGPLANKCQELGKRVKATFTPDKEAFYKSEFAFVDLVTSLSGEIMAYDKAQRKEKLRLRLKDDVFHDLPKLQHLYLPTNPDFRITGVIPHTAGAMQSAAKCPILVQFTCVPRAAEDTRTPAVLAMAATDEREQAAENNHGNATPHPVVKACIFKMGDDCRQDQISLQLIGFMQRILCSVDVPSFLYPYRVVTTGQSSGIIECVPRSKSRNEIGKLVESNLAEFFVQTFGDPESVGFRRARENFVKSTAAYSVVSFILNIKDRHNGNIMIDADGNLVHIDFGFLFDVSPGGDINFESSPFKLTTEMVQLIGKNVGGNSTLQSKTLTRALVDEENYIYFKTLLNRCYLAVREYAREICIMVELMLESGLPCFKPKQTIANLAQRLAIDMNEIDAANYMRRRIHESRQNYRTVLYDFYQKVAEGIEM